MAPALTVLESDPEALHFPALGHTTDDGLLRCGGSASRVARLTKFEDLVTCMTCVERMGEAELAERRRLPDGV